MSSLTLGFLTLSTIPFLLFCLLGFHSAPRKRVIFVTLLRPNRCFLNAAEESTLLVPRRPPRHAGANGQISVAVSVAVVETKRIPIALKP
jgi:hypothetical protein